MNLPGDLVDLTTKVNANVEGHIFNENDAAVEGAVVTAGSATVSTDKFGYFKFDNVALTKNAAFVSVTAPGYFTATKTFVVTQNQSNSVRIKLLPKTIAGSIDAGSGGTVALINGVGVSLPENSVINQSTGAAYNGEVKIALNSVSPLSNDLNLALPGDFRGINSNGMLKSLTSYGMSAVELIGSSGEKLQIAAGKKAIINFPLPLELSGNAPSAIPVWYFDESIGLWKEEGSANKVNNGYVAQVSHVSYWEFGEPSENAVHFSATVVDKKGLPVPSAQVIFHNQNDTATIEYASTNTEGFVSGFLPANSQLIMEIISTSWCGDAPYVQNITTTASSLDLGQVAIDLPIINATINGTLVDCNNQALENGYVSIKYGYYWNTIPLTAGGSFSFPFTVCVNQPLLYIIPVDRNGHQQGNTIAHSLTEGENALGNLAACGVSTQEFINYKINGVNYSFDAASDTILCSKGGYGVLVSGYDQINHVSDSLYFDFQAENISVNEAQTLHSLVATVTGEQAYLIGQGDIPINITEFGEAYEFIAGNFSGTFVGAAPANKVYNISCTFRIRKNF